MKAPSEKKCIERGSIILLFVLGVCNFAGLQGQAYYLNFEYSIVKALLEVLAVLGAYEILRRIPSINEGDNS